MLRTFFFIILLILVWKWLKNYLQKVFGQHYHINGEPKRGEQKRNSGNVIDAEFRELDEEE